MNGVPMPNPISVEVDGLKISGVKTYRVNIFDAWKDKGVILKQPLAKYSPPENLDAIIKLGIAQSLNKQEEEVKKQLNTNQQNVILSHMMYRAGYNSGITYGGAMFSWNDISNWFNSVAQGAENAASGAVNTVTNAGKTVWQGAENLANDVTKIWNSVVHLADLVNEMYAFMKEWRQTAETINNRLMELTSENQALTRAANNLILENRQFYADLSKSMNASLAKYFDDLTFNLLKYGQVTIPTAVVGAITLTFKNHSALPLSATIPDLTIKSGPYVLHKGTYVVNMLPFESDTGDVPFDIYGVEESKYLLDAKKNNKPIPITVEGTLITPMGKEPIQIHKEVVL